MATTVERLMVEVAANTSSARAQLTALDRSTKSTVTKSGSSVARLARGMGLAFGGAAVIGGITKTIGLAMDFDKTMRAVGVQTGLTGDRIDRLGDLAKDMGQKTIFSAKDAGQAMLELAKGGLTAADIRAGALNQTLRLAAAGGLDLESSASVIANGLNMFGLKAKQAGQVTTALAGAANASTASVDSLRMALSQVGPGARTAGLSIQETVAALAEFDNAGVKGSDAGTSLKTMLQRLVPMTEKAASAMKANNLEFTDAHGNFLGLADIAENLRKHLGNLAPVQRQQALNTIFGSDASRAAAILMRGGAKEVEKYTKAAKDQEATQKMANVAMKGASGAWENFKGTVETLAISLGQKALPAVEDILNRGNELLASSKEWGPGVAHDFGLIASAGKALFAVAQPIAQVALDLARGFQALPDPIKQTTLLVGAAALVWPRLSAAAVGALTPIGTSLVSTTAKTKQFAASMTYSATRAQALSGAIRGVAGPAGMGLMVAGASSSNQALQTLGTVGGGALMGFAAGGPIGAAVGAGAGLLGVLATNSAKAGDAARESQADYSGLAGTLDQLTGATTASTHAFVYDQLARAGTLKDLAAYGIQARTAVAAILGETKARQTVTNAIDAQQTHYDGLIAQIKRLEAAQQSETNLTGARAYHFTQEQADRAKLIEQLKAEAAAERTQIASVRDGIGATKSATREVRARARATQDLTGKLHGIPKNVRTKIQAEGIQPTARGIAQLTRRFHLVPKQVKTLIAAAGVDTTVREVEKIKQHLNDVSKAKPNLAPFNEAVRRSGAIADSDAKRSAQAIKGSLEKGPRDAKGDLHAYQQSIRSGVGAAREIASAGGLGVGAALKGGVLSGMSGLGDQLAGQAASAVRQAVAAARAEAKIKSPSRVMRDKVGKPLAEGVIQGMRDKRRAIIEGGRDLIRDLVSGIKSGQGEALRSLRHVGRFVEKYMSGKQENAWKGRIHDATRRVRDDYERLAKVTDRLAKAQANLQGIRSRQREFMGNIRTGMTAQASVTNAGATAGAIAGNLAIQAGKVKQFANMLRRLKRRGWADQIIRDIAAAGVEGGFETAKALLAASDSEQKSINASYRAIYKTANESAKQMGQAMYGSGIKAAQGVVKGLRDRRQHIKDMLTNLAEHMADALRKAIDRMADDLGARVHHAEERRRRHKKRDQEPRSGSGGAGARGYRAGPGEGPSRAVQAGFRRIDGSHAVRHRNGNVIHFHFRTYYPKSEPQSVTVNRTLQRVGVLGLLG